MYNHFFVCIIIVASISQISSRKLSLPLYTTWNSTGVIIAEGEIQGEGEGEGEGNVQDTCGADYDYGGTAGRRSGLISGVEQPFGLEISDNDELYISDSCNNRILILHLDVIDKTFTEEITADFYLPHDVFVTDEALYILDTGNKQVIKMGFDESVLIVAELSNLSWPVFCFIGRNDSIYVTDQFTHIIALFHTYSIDYTVAAGTGISGSDNDQLKHPYGIFVNDFDTLYIADKDNNRIMKWTLGATEGVRVAGDGTDGSSNTQVSHPTQLIVDEDENLYILEGGNARISRWKANTNFGECIVACTGINGIKNNQLNGPSSLAFDSYGNIYVSEWDSNQVKKFRANPGPISYNQPEIPVNATWSTNGITFANKNTLGERSRGLYIDLNNVIYVASHEHNRIFIWSNNSIEPTIISHVQLFPYSNLFVTINGDIYFSSSQEQGRIHKYSKESTNETFIAKFPEYCYFIFIDVRNFLYCSILSQHRIVKMSLNRPNTPIIHIAGTEGSGSASDQLDEPWGIYVDTYLNIYVADSNNDRIQYFEFGFVEGETIAGNNTPNNLQLKHPTGITLDADDFLYITDNDNHRIIQVDADSYRCIIGCTEQQGSAANQLNKPYAIQFDSFGGLYIIDEHNDRLQKFYLKDADSCDDFTFTTEFSPFSSSISSPIRFQRNQNIYISSTIKHNCTSSSLLFQSQWTIPSYSNQILGKDLFIPARSLAYGIYKIELTVTSNRHQITSSTFTYIEICQPIIMLQLFSFSASTLTHHYADDLILNPGEYSFQLDEISFNKNNWFYFYYYRIFDSNQNETFQLINQTNSSIRIVAGTLQLNQTYQFRVEMIHQQNQSLRLFEYLNVHIVDIRSPIILIDCLLRTMCSSNGQFHYVNPTTELALYALCISGNCSSVEYVQWKIHSSSSNQTIQWNIFPSEQTNWLFYGLNTKNLTVLKDLFIEYNQSQYWRFELIYLFESQTYNQTFDIEINQPPRNGYCSVHPQNGSSIDLISINCSEWYDDDDIKDYTIYLKFNSSLPIILNHSIASLIYIQLPLSIKSISTYELIVRIRDRFDCSTEYPLPIITIHGNSDLMKTHSIISICHFFDEINDQSIQSILQSRNDISPTSISVTSLNNEKLARTNNSLHEYSDFDQLDEHASIRENFIISISNLSVNTIDEIRDQSCLLSQLTKTTNQLTRLSATIGLNKCFRLSNQLKIIQQRLSIEDIRLISAYLLECSTNIIEGVNRILQGRTHRILNLDLMRTNKPVNEEQKQTLNQLIQIQTKIISSITDTLNIHLNINQSIRIKTGSIDFFLKKTHQTNFIRQIIERLAIADDNYPSRTNLSRSLSFVDEYFITDRKQFFIPRDPNLSFPPLVIQNVTLLKNSKRSFFNYHRFNLTQDDHQNLTYSIHFELYPLQVNLSYLFIYEFDPQEPIGINNSVVLCSNRDLIQNEYYKHFLNNEKTHGHHSIVYGIRELREDELEEYCSNGTTKLDIKEPFVFTSNYRVRAYQSGCFYLDFNDQWQSDGLLVGPLTNHDETHCLMTI